MALSLQVLLSRSEVASEIDRVRADAEALAATQVQGVQHDSRKVSDGDIFVAIAGQVDDGARYIEDAVSKGACAIVSANQVDCKLPVLICRDPRKTLGVLAALVYGSADAQRIASVWDALKVVGVTGSNGKTSSVALLDWILKAANVKAARLGTLGLQLPDGSTRETSFTTPEGDDLARMGVDMKRASADVLSMEVSSHALALKRVDAISFFAVAFTNLTQDHLDFHKTMQAYADAKSRLFLDLKWKYSIINRKQPLGLALIEKIQHAGRASDVWAFAADGYATKADLMLEVTDASATGMQVRCATPAGELRFRVRLMGEHNLENLAIAIGCALRLDVDKNVIVNALEAFEGVPGRLQLAAEVDGVAAFVDYAHTPDAVEKALLALRPLCKGNLWIVFGAGGDRDKGKRPLMGEAAGKFANRVIVTSDNPRTESPLAIMHAIEAGVPKTSHRVSIEDRDEAIRYALFNAEKDDVVLIAGKGHESHQMIGTQKIAFEDKERARYWANQRAQTRGEADT